MNFHHSECPIFVHRVDLSRSTGSLAHQNRSNAVFYHVDSIFSLRLAIQLTRTYLFYRHPSSESDNITPWSFLTAAHLSVFSFYQMTGGIYEWAHGSISHFFMLGIAISVLPGGSIVFFLTDLLFLLLFCVLFVAPDTIQCSSLTGLCFSSTLVDARCIFEFKLYVFHTS